jgi:hypothetical protein
MKKLLSIVLVLTLALALCLPAMAEDFTIAINLKTLSSEYWQNVKAGCDAAAEELGVNSDVQGAAAETEIAEQVAQLETQLAGAPDAVIIAPLDGDAVIGAIESSGYQGIVVFCDTDCAYEGKTSFVGTSNEVAAKQGGDYGVAINGADTKAVIIYGQEGDNTSNLRKSGYEKAVAEAGLGGIYNSSVDAFVGGSTYESIRNLSVQIAAMAASGISIRHGLSNNTYFEAELKREVVKNCKTLLLLADGDKFDREALFSFCPLEKVSAVVTDRPPHPRYLEFFDKQGIQVLYPVEK